jgi:hypothetical protein
MSSIAHEIQLGAARVPGMTGVSPGIARNGRHGLHG